MSPADVLRLLREIGELLGMGLQLIEIARQLRPELRAEPLPDAGAEMRSARDAARRRAAEGEDEDEDEDP